MQTLIFFSFPCLPLLCADSFSLIPSLFFFFFVVGHSIYFFLKRSGGPWRGRRLPLNTFSGNQKIMCAHCSQIMFLLDAVKDTVAVETQDLDPPGLDAKHGPYIFLQAAGGLGVLGRERQQALRWYCGFPYRTLPSDCGCLLQKVRQSSYFSICHPLFPYLHPTSQTAHYLAGLTLDP